jgi:hypothetical protein
MFLKDLKKEKKGVDEGGNPSKSNKRVLNCWVFKLFFSPRVNKS